VAFKGHKELKPHKNGVQSQDFSYLESFNCHHFLLDWFAIFEFASGKAF